MMDKIQIIPIGFDANKAKQIEAEIIRRTQEEMGWSPCESCGTPAPHFICEACEQEADQS